MKNDAHRKKDYVSPTVERLGAVIDLTLGSRDRNSGHSGLHGHR
jgi:hypothetical protein